MAMHDLKKNGSNVEKHLMKPTTLKIKKRKMYSGCRKINIVSVGAFCVCKALNKTGENIKMRNEMG